MCCSVWAPEGAERWGVNDFRTTVGEGCSSADTSDAESSVKRISEASRASNACTGRYGRHSTVYAAKEDEGWIKGRFRRHEKPSMREWSLRVCEMSETDPVLQGQVGCNTVNTKKRCFRGPGSGFRCCVCCCSRLACNHSFALASFVHPCPDWLAGPGNILSSHSKST